jgi:hypothetical protein
MFAPETLRERNRRSGINGFAARAWRATNAPSSPMATAPSASVWVDPQPSSSTPRIVYTPSISPPMSSAALGRSAPAASPIPSRSGTSLIANSPVAMPIGMLTKKIQCQLIVSVRTPPTRSPIEPPATATKV